MNSRHTQSIEVQKFILTAFALLPVGVSFADSEDSEKQAGRQISDYAYWPVATSSAGLSTEGSVEVETGWSPANGGAPIISSMQYLTHFAFNNRWEIMQGGDLWPRNSESNHSLANQSNTFFAIKHLIETDDEHQALGLELGVSAPIVKDGFSQTSNDWKVNSIYSLDLADKWRFDTNLAITRLGLNELGVSKNVYSWTSCITHQFGDWSLAGELTGTHQPGAPPLHQLLIMRRFSISPNLILDAGMSHEKQDVLDQSAVMFGFTWLTGKM